LLNASFSESFDPEIELSDIIKGLGMLRVLRRLIFSTDFLWDRQIGCISQVNFPGTFFHLSCNVMWEVKKKRQDTT